MDGNVFGHGYHEGNLRLDSLLDGLGSLVSWHVDGRCIGLCFLLSLNISESQISMSLKTELD